MCSCSRAHQQHWFRWTGRMLSSPWLMDDSLGLSLNSHTLEYTCLPGAEIVPKSYWNWRVFSACKKICIFLFGVFPKGVDQHMSSASVQAPILWPRLSYSHNPKEYCCQVTSSSNMRSNSMIVILSPTTVSSSWGSKTKKYSHQIQVVPSLCSKVAFVKDDKLSQLKVAIGCLTGKAKHLSQICCVHLLPNPRNQSFKWHQMADAKCIQILDLMGKVPKGIKRVK